MKLIRFRSRFLNHRLIKSSKQALFTFFCVSFYGAATIAHAEEFNAATFLKAQNENKQIVLHFFADWCPVCHEQKRSLKKLEDANKLKDYIFFEVNFDQETGLKEDLKVFSQSSFLAFKGSKEVGRLLNNISPDEIEKFLITAFNSKNLNETIKESSSKNISDAKQKIMKKAEDELRASFVLQKAPQKGSLISEFSLPNALGKTITLSSYLKKGPVVLSFYRGAWCPYCNLQLRAYQQILPQIRSLGAELIAITPEKPKLSSDLKSKESLEFEIVTDANNKYARKLGLVFSVNAELKKLYLDMGIDLKKSQGNAAWELPIPATFVINSKGEITYSFLTVDYKQRAEPGEILKALIDLRPQPQN